jgi:hypothetical protein
VIEAKATAISDTKAQVLERMRDQNEVVAFSGMLQLLLLQRSELEPEV